MSAGGGVWGEEALGGGEGGERIRGFSKVPSPTATLTTTRMERCVDRLLILLIRRNR